MADDLPDPLVGRTLKGRFDVRRRIGHGGMGVVYECFDRSLHTRVAVKTLLPEHQSTTAVQRFLSEARALASIRHEHVVSVYDVDTDRVDGVLLHFLVMQYVDGSDLRSALRQGRLAPERVAEVVRQAASGLHAAHEAGLLHRDVKPENLLVAGDPHTGTVYVGDFGIAKAHGAPRFTPTRHVVGTPGYIAPELWRGQEADRRADVWSLGCVVFELLTASPWAGVRGAAAVQGGEVGELLSRHGVDLPELGPVLGRALHDDPKKRFADALDLAAAVSRAIEAGSPRTSDRIPTPVLQQAELVPAPPPQVPPVVKPARSRRMAAVLGAAASAVALLGVGWAVISLQDRDLPDVDVQTAGQTVQLPRFREVVLEEDGLPATEVDRAVLDSVSEQYRDCFQVQPPDEERTSSVNCDVTPEGLDSLQVRQFQDTDAMDGAFNRLRVKHGYREARCSDFPGGRQSKGTGHYSSWDGGGLACYVNDPGHAVLLWQVDELALQLVAIRQDADSAALFDWWMRERDTVVVQQ